ncbi:MAG TPA: DUF2779 domain-containing protein [Acetobacteraceae bacterium]|nr:DUF2779 domain-containing protein [Acetobacteraceae bacterium]
MTLHLTKSRYMAGLQCPRRLWLLVHEPPPYEEPAPGTPIDIGQEIGRKAHLLFPGGVEITEAPWEHAQAVARTTALIADASVPAIFEAAFTYDRIRIRVDVLERLASGAWGLREVKRSSRLKDHYIDDIALQAYVLRGTGLDVRSIELLHVNTAYVRDANGIAWPDFFARLDVGEAVSAALVDLRDRLPAMRECLDANTLPEAEPGSQCRKPYPCEFWDRCTPDKPSDWISYMPHLSPAQAESLKALGIEAISGIPPDFPLTARQTIIRDSIATGRPFVAPDLRRLLGTYGPPACYLDFEAMMPPIPLYEGTRPFQTIPFQWSLHTLASDGALHHQEFLADGDADPRRAFAATLIAALAGADFPIIVYSPYEQQRLKELAAAFPDLHDPIAAIVDRLRDLLPIVRGAVYFPAARFSNSIKLVGPALCPGFTYDDLEEIGDGVAASAAFLQLASGRLADPDEIDRLRTALRLYCERDTLAMVEVHRALMRLAKNPDD